MNHKYNKGGVKMENILIGIMIVASFVLGFVTGVLMMDASIDSVITYKETQNAVVFSKQYLLDKNIARYNEKTGKLEVLCQK